MQFNKAIIYFFCKRFFHKYPFFSIFIIYIYFENIRYYWINNSLERRISLDKKKSNLCQIRNDKNKFSDWMVNELIKAPESTIEYLLSGCLTKNINYASKYFSILCWGQEKTPLSKLLITFLEKRSKIKFNSSAIIPKSYDVTEYRYRTLYTQVCISIIKKSIRYFSKSMYQQKSFRGIYYYFTPPVDGNPTVFFFHHIGLGGLKHCFALDKLIYKGFGVFVIDFPGISGNCDLNILNKNSLFKRIRKLLTVLEINNLILYGDSFGTILMNQFLYYNKSVLDLISHIYYHHPLCFLPCYTDFKYISTNYLLADTWSDYYLNNINIIDSIEWDFLNNFKNKVTVFLQNNQILATYLKHTYSKIEICNCESKLFSLSGCNCIEKIG